MNQEVENLMAIAAKMRQMITAERDMADTLRATVARLREENDMLRRACAKHGLSVEMILGSRHA